VINLPNVSTGSELYFRSGTWSGASRKSGGSWGGAERWTGDAEKRWSGAECGAGGLEAGSCGYRNTVGWNAERLFRRSCSAHMRSPTVPVCGFYRAAWKADTV